MIKQTIKIASIFLIFILSGCGGSDRPKTIDKVNLVPVAHIDMTQYSIVLTDSITISGESSSDPDGDALTYEWKIQNEAGDESVLEDNSAESFVFTPEYFGSYNVTLIVRDGKQSSESVSSRLIVEPNVQSFPIAVTSNDLSSKMGNVNWFSAENSTAVDGQSITYQWEIKSKPATSNSVIGDAAKVKAYLITDVAGLYEVLLTVTNSDDQLTATSELTITAEEVLTNSAPVAVISEPMSSYAPNQMIRLSAASSYDSDNDPLEYQWSLALPSTAHNSSLAGDTTEFVEFYVDGLGEYQLTLTITDGLLSDEITAIIMVTSDNIAPVANAGSDKVVSLGIALELDGSGSSDVDGDSLQYKWSLVSKPITSNYSDLDNASFISYSNFAFMADVVGEYLMALEVYDGLDYSTLDQVYLEVTENQRPVALLPDDIVTNSNGSHVVENAGSYDPEGQYLNYSWQLVSVPDGSNATLTSPIIWPFAQFISDLPGTYTIQMTANDGVQYSLPATVNIVYSPEVLHELAVSGQLVDSGGIPLSMIEVGGIFQTTFTSDQNGNFDVVLKSKEQDVKLTVLTLEGENILSTILKVPETDEVEVNLGQVKLPVLQRKDISLKACQSYKGTEKLTVYFYLTTEGYEDMKFYKPIAVELTLGEEPIQVRLPAAGAVNMRLATSTTGQVYVDGGNSFFTHQYQADDSQADPLVITVCN
jgi:hypothetical protein